MELCVSVRVLLIVMQNRSQMKTMEKRTSKCYVVCGMNVDATHIDVTRCIEVDAQAHGSHRFFMNYCGICVSSSRRKFAIRPCR